MIVPSVPFRIVALLSPGFPSLSSTSALSASSFLVGGMLSSSTHIKLSLINFRPVGHAQEIFGLLALICGAGRHRCEQ
uniref:Putative secreted protein n=1 Tax=Anopheles darlingi TaxID=43151 RepID=A0A2M4D9H0_ANODA